MSCIFIRHFSTKLALTDMRTPDTCVLAYAIHTLKLKNVHSVAQISECSRSNIGALFSNTHRESIPVDIETKCANTVGREKKLRWGKIEISKQHRRERVKRSHTCFDIATEHYSAIRTESMLFSINKWCFIKSHWLLLMLHCRWYWCRSHRNGDGRAGAKKKTPTNVKSILLAHRVAWMHKMLTASKVSASESRNAIVQLLNQ